MKINVLATLAVIMLLWGSGYTNVTVSCLLLTVLMTIAITNFTGTAKGGLIPHVQNSLKKQQA